MYKQIKSTTQYLKHSIWKIHFIHYKKQLNSTVGKNSTSKGNKNVLIQHQKPEDEDELI